MGPRKDAASAPAAVARDTSEPQPRPGTSQDPPQQAPAGGDGAGGAGAVNTAVVLNIAVHSLLMVTVPFAVFFASLYGGLDPVYQLTGRSVPSREVKTYIGAGLAVLAVNLVIASFVLAAFGEQPPPDSKKRD